MMWLVYIVFLENGIFGFFFLLKKKNDNLKFLIFFFWESRSHGQVLFQEKNYNASLVTRETISSGVNSIQNCSPLFDLERLARKWATELPKRLTWLNLQVRNSATKTRLSYITWPYSGWCTSLPSNTLMMSSASPSKTTLKMHSSLANNNTLLQVRASTIAADVRSGTHSAKDPITLP